MAFLTKDLVKALGFFQIALADVLGPPLLLGGLGYLGYRKFHWPAGAVVVLTALGAVAGFWRLYRSAVRVAEDDEKSELLPFLGASAIWAGLCVGALAWVQGMRAYLPSFLALWFICTLNFCVIFIFIRKVSVVLSGNKTPARLADAATWGAMKLISLFILIKMIWHFRGVPGMTLLLALLTVAVIPLVGGAVWVRTVKPE